MVSFTITEKGYSLTNGNGEFLKDIAIDFNNEPSVAKSYIGKLPLTLVSMDNCSHNGTKLENAITTFAKYWTENKVVEPEFLTYVKEYISYPWSMIDKITPRPAESVIKMLKDIGFEDPELDANNLIYIPLAIAGWCRYLMAIDDEGNSFELSPDPLLTSLTPIIDNIKLGKIENIHETLSQILSNKSIFGVNLYEIGLGTKIEDYFEELITGKGAVRSTLKRIIANTLIK